MTLSLHHLTKLPASDSPRPFDQTQDKPDSVYPTILALNGRGCNDTLQGLGPNLEYLEFNMGHNVSEESLAVINTWLTIQLQ